MFEKVLNIKKELVIQDGSKVLRVTTTKEVEDEQIVEVEDMDRIIASLDRKITKLQVERDKLLQLKQEIIYKEIKIHVEA